MKKIISKSSLFSFITLALILTFLCGTAFCWAEASPGERILSYDSNIVINPDSSLIVTENIKVKSEGINIKTGIYRDFPTKYTGKSGKQYRVGFEVLSVKRNGENQNYQIENLSNGKRVYMRDKGILIPPGEYTFTLQYKTTKQLGFFKGHDELYYNITGNGWAFPIDQASATILLPSPVPSSDIKISGFTGYKDSEGKDFNYAIKEDQQVIFQTTRGLAEFEGLTIVVGWPKGLVTPPPKEKESYNYIAYISLGVIITLLYFILAWNKVGKDPKKGTIIPLYYPPEGFSPPALRYISRMGFDTKAFSSSIINMAVSGFLNIKEESSGLLGGKTFSIIRTGKDRSVLSPEEGLIADELLGHQDSFDFEQTNYSQVSSATNSLSLYLSKNYKKKYFNTNYGYFSIGLLLSIVGYLSAMLSLGADALALVGFISMWLTIWSIGVSVLLSLLIKSWKMAASHSKGSLPRALFLTVFSIPFVIGEIIGLAILAFSKFPLFLGFLILFSLNILFWHLLKAPTAEGRSLLDKIEGFKMYLSYAEKDELNYSAPVDMTPETFEKYLPFALALDVENQWSEKFAAALASSSVEPDYHPVWYTGAAWNIHDMSGFTSSIGNGFSSAISSSSTAPGSSSGFSGGSSGGGGGGGGGGGC